MAQQPNQTLPPHLRPVLAVSVEVKDPSGDGGSRTHNFAHVSAVQPDAAGILLLFNQEMKPMAMFALTNLIAVLFPGQDVLASKIIQPVIQLVPGSGRVN